MNSFTMSTDTVKNNQLDAHLQAVPLDVIPGLTLEGSVGTESNPPQAPTLQAHQQVPHVTEHDMGHRQNALRENDDLDNLLSSMEEQIGTTNGCPQANAIRDHPLACSAGIITSDNSSNPVTFQAAAPDPILPMPADFSIPEDSVDDMSVLTFEQNEPWNPVPLCNEDTETVDTLMAMPFASLPSQEDMDDISVLTDPGRDDAIIGPPQRCSSPEANDDTTEVAGFLQETAPLESIVMLTSQNDHDMIEDEPAMAHGNLQDVDSRDMEQDEEIHEGAGDETEVPGTVVSVDPPGTIVREIGDADILKGRGGATNKNPANKAFRKLVRQNLDIYRASSKSRKTDIATAVVRAIQRDGGRFLDRLKTTDGTPQWVVVTDKEARRKVSQRFREEWAKIAAGK